MSASSKKKLRKEQNAALLTEKQQQAKKEAKKLKIVTIAFVAVFVAVVVVFAAIMIGRGVENSGVRQKNTVAATVGEHEINSVELNYYFTDMINNWASQFGENATAYMSMFGLDPTVPLDEQAYTEGEDGQTWADYFMDAALEKAKQDYTLYDAAMAAGHELSEEEQLSVDNAMATLDFYVQMSNGNYKNVNQYLSKFKYGPGSTEKSYKAYIERSAIASSYYNAYAESLTYTAEQIGAFDAEHASDYNSYTYASYRIDYTKFLTDGQKDDKGNTTYTDAQHEAARAAAKAAAQSLLTAKTVEEFDKAIAALSINEKTPSAASTKNNGTMGTNVAEEYAEWVTDTGRKENDIEMFEIKNSITEGEEEKTTIAGYYVVMYQSVKDNATPVGNVRHLLVKFKNGTTENGETTYSEEEKAAAKEKADAYLKEWEAGAKTEESFIQLVKDHSEDTSAAEGGLFEDITPKSNYVESFRNWATDEKREAGHTEVIESEYGYHVMYYVGDSELNYRQTLISEDMRSADLEEWYNGLTENVEAKLGNLKRIDQARVFSAA